MVCGAGSNNIYDYPKNEEGLVFLTSGFDIIFTTNVVMTHVTANAMVLHLGERYEKGLGVRFKFR